MASKGVEVEWKEGEGRMAGMASASSLKGRGGEGWGGGALEVRGSTGKTHAEAWISGKGLSAVLRRLMGDVT